MYSRSSAVIALRFIATCKPDLAKLVLRYLDDGAVRLFHEIAFNCLNNTAIELTPSQSRRLATQKRQLKLLANKQVSLQRKRRILSRLPLAFVRFLIELALPMLDLYG